MDFVRSGSLWKDERPPDFDPECCCGTYPSIHHALEALFLEKVGTFFAVIVQNNMLHFLLYSGQHSLGIV